MPLPIPDACQFDADTLRVADFDTGLFPESGYVGLALLYAYDGYHYVYLDTFFDNGGRDIPFTPTGAFTLRYARVDTSEWSVLADVDPDSAGTGYHYEYEFTGDVESGSALSGFRKLNTTYADFSAPEYSKSVTVTVVANRVRDSDSAVVCTDTDTISGLIGPYEEWGDPSDTILSCDDGATALSVTLAPASGCPGDTITATGNYTITGATLSGDALTLSPTSGTVVSFVLPESITEAGDVSIVFTTDAAIDTPTATKTLTIGEECFETPTPCTPPAPVACFDSLTALQLSAVPAADFPVCTTNLKLQTKTGAGSWTDRQTGIVADTPYSISLNIAPSMKARFVSDDGTAGAEITLDLCECETVVLPPDEVSIPAVPAAPTLAKNCADSTITVTSPAFSTATGAHTTSIEIRRRNAPDGAWVTVHTFASAMTWTDSGTAALGSYDYAARACNGAGCSEWSGNASISLISTTPVSFASPPADATWHGLKKIRVTGISGLTAPTMSWNGASIGTPSYKNSEWVLDWETYFSAQGAGTLRFEATGADGCRCFAERALTLDNSAPAQTATADVICRENVAPDGMRVKSASFRFEAAPIPAASWRQTFMRVAAYLDDEGASDDFELEFDEDTWAQGQPLLLERGRVLGDGTAQWLWFDLLAKKGEVTGKRAIFRLRWDAAFVQLGYSTLGAGSSIVKFRDDGNAEDDDYRVLLLARKADNSGAAIYAFDGSAATQLYDLSDYSASAAFDFALAGDKFFIASGSELFFIDTDSGEASGDLAPRTETRDLVTLESIGTKLYAFFAGEADTVCWRWDGSWKSVWTLGAAVTKAARGEDGLLLACGAKLYTTTGDATPVLQETFGTNISALCDAFVGLSDGKLMELVNEEWTPRLDRTGAMAAATAVSFITGETEDPRGVAGEAGSTHLLEATINPAAWSDGRTLEAPALMTETVTGVSALHRFLKQTKAAEGNPNMPGYKPAVYREILLIGTTPDGALLTIEQNPLAQNPLAVPATQAGAIRALPVLEAAPISEE